MGVYDVPATELVEEVARDFTQKLKVPAFTDYVKSGSHRERRPHRRDWWHVRAASILYRVFRDGPVGTEGLRTYYGGRKARGRAPDRFAKASGKVVRSCLQALEREGLVKKDKKGRGITQKGQSYLVKKANIVRKRVAEERKREAEAKSAGAKERAEREAKAAQKRADELKEAEARKDAVKEKQAEEAQAAKGPEPRAGAAVEKPGPAKKESAKEAAKGPGKRAGEAAKEAGEKKAPEKETKEKAGEEKSKAMAKKAEEVSRKMKEKERSAGAKKPGGRGAGK